MPCGSCSVSRSENGDCFMFPSRLLAIACLVLFCGVLRSGEDKPAYRVLGADTGHVAIVGPDGKLEWDYPNKAECHDLTLLPGGNILMVTGRATVSEVTRDKKIVWNYEAKPKDGYKGRVEVHAFQRLD